VLAVGGLPGTKNGLPRYDGVEEAIVLCRLGTAATLLLALHVSAVAGPVDVGALLKETEAAVEKLDDTIDKAGLRASLAAICAKRGDRPQALQLLNAAVNLALKVRPNAGPRINRWNQYFLVAHAIEEEARLGAVADALRHAKSLSDLGKSHAPEFDNVAKGQAIAGDVAGAWATCDRLDARWSDRKAMALYRVAVALARNRRFDAALQTADRIGQLPAKNIEKAKINRLERDDTISMIACEQATCGKLEDGLQTLERTNGDPAKVRTLQQMAEICHKRGDQRGARNAIRTALSVFVRLKAVERRALWSLAVSLADVGDVAAALETTSKFVESRAQGYALLAVSIAQAKAGDRATSAQTFKQGLALAKSGPLDDGYSLIDAANKQTEAGDFDRALEIARSLDRPQSVLWQVSVGQAKAGDFRRALKIAESIADDSETTATVLCEIATLQTKAKQPLARRTLQRAFEAAMADRDLPALKDIGLGQLRAGSVEAAADTFREARKEVIQSGYDPANLVDIAQAQAGGGDPAAALAWSRSQSSALFKACGLVGVLQGLTDGPE
jgi:tetratricopeptide (TPR) repeat protein